MAEIRAALKDQVEDKYFDKPIFIFEDSANATLRRSIFDLCKEAHILCVTIDDEEEALSMRTKYSKKDTGVFFIPFEFCRGLDLKLKVDAHCIILDTSNKFKESDVLQAMGRACRSQG